MANLLQKIQRDHLVSQAEAKEPTTTSRLCEVVLAKGAKPFEMTWLRGLHAKKEIFLFVPGKPIRLPLDRVHSWFGPFDRFKEYEEEINRPVPNEKVVQALTDHISVEMARVLNQWGYPYVGKGRNPDMTPIGPHRFPDLTITVLNADGEDDSPIRCHEVYGIGEFDDKEFRAAETEDQIRLRYEAILHERDKEAEAMRREVAKLTGLVQGMVISTDPKLKAAKDAVPA